jgi:hypothetical protein
MSLPCCGLRPAGGRRSGARAPKVSIATARRHREGQGGGFEYAELGVKNFTKLTTRSSPSCSRSRRPRPAHAGGQPLPAREIKVVGRRSTRTSRCLRAEGPRAAEKLGLKIVVFGSGGSRKVPDGFSKTRPGSSWWSSPSAWRPRPRSTDHPGGRALRKEETNTITAPPRA